MKKTTKGILLILIATLFLSAGQVFFKIASDNFDNLESIIYNPMLWIGLILYGTGALLTVLGFREGDLSMLYPFVALSYIWVFLVSIIFFGEAVTFSKAGGIILIIGGVTVLGVGMRG